MSRPLCPYCCSPRIDAHYVDIGVGEQQATPYHCFDCDAVEFNPYDDHIGATPEEKSIGWYRGLPEEKSVGGYKGFPE